MLRLRFLTLVGGALVLSTTLVKAQDTELKAVVQKAITAHGGEKLLLKYPAGTAKFKGNIEINSMKFDFNGEIFTQKPDKMKNVMSLEIGNQQIPIVYVFNGKTFWMSTNGDAKELKDEKLLKETREDMLADDPASLINILKEPFELSSLGETKIMGKDAIGIRVSKKGQRDYSLFFDKKTNLIAKIEVRGIEQNSGNEITKEKFFTDYKDRDGLKSPSRLTIHHDGNFFMELEITESQPLEKLDESTFAMP